MGVVGRTAARRGPAAVGVLLGAVVSVAVSACAPSPTDAADGELSAVVVARSDQPFPFAGGTVDAWSRVVVLSREGLLAAFASTWPGREAPADHDLPALVVEVGAADLPAGDLAEVSEGRFRVPWPEPGRYLCLGNEHEGVVTTAGCVLVDAEAPVEVTLESSIGGFALKT